MVYLLKSGNFGSLLSSAKTSEKAVDNALKGVKNKVKKFILKHFKLEADVVEVLENSTGIPKSILVAGGSAARFKKNKKLFLQIRTPKTLPNGRTLIRTKEIGLIKIDKVEDEHFSVCTVLKGGDKLAQALEKKKAVICLTKK